MVTDDNRKSQSGARLTPASLQWREAQRLLRPGAMTQRGRPPSDPETHDFHRVGRALQQAVKNMPSDMRREWNNRPNINETDILGPRRTEDARQRAYARQQKRAQSDEGAEPALAEHAASQTQEKRERQRLVAGAVAVLERNGRRVTSKTVLNLLEQWLAHRNQRPLGVQLDTIRRDISHIRRARQK